ncbi:MAG: thioredoxin [Planctomycetota bacterium]|jgi:thioredoxin 1
MASKNLLELTDANFQQQSLESDKPVLVDFWADWCQPCHIIAPTIDELADEYAGRVTVAKLDVDANQEVAKKLGISSIPTILLFRGGAVVKKFAGVTPKQDLVNALDAILTTADAA